MNDTNKLIRDLITNDESEVIEFKLNFHSPEEIGERISALANSACLLNKAYGFLIFGIEDSTRKIIGTDFNPKTKKVKNEELENWLVNRLSPKIDFQIHEANIDGHKIILFKIPAAKGSPVCFDRNSYIRVGSATRKLYEFPDKEAKIWAKSNHSDWSAEICKDASIDDLSSLAIDTARSLYISKHPDLKDEINTWNDSTFLNKAKLCINGKVTKAALILLGKPESEHFISPSTSRITWILKDKNNIDKGHQHFTMPILLAVDQIYAKIRNLKYQYMLEGTLFPEEVDQYDPYIIREALHNCIAHQDYRVGGNISIVESEDAKLIFSNSGQFIPETIDRVISADAPEQVYRNRFLVDAMVNLKMIETIGSGIRRMFNIQRKRFFPLPEYDLSNNQVKVTIIGKVLNTRYAEILFQMPQLSLFDAILLDKIQKKQKIDDIDLKSLRQRKLIEGRKPNIFISSYVAANVGLEKDYIEQSGFNDQYYQDTIIRYLREFSPAKKNALEVVLFDKLPKVLDDDQKRNKIKNLLQLMKRQGIIILKGKEWYLP